MCVLQAFVRSSEPDVRLRNNGTLASIHLTCQGDTAIRHPCMYKLVYIIPEKRFGRIIGVHDAGTHFYVEAKSKEHSQVFAGKQLLQTYVQSPLYMITSDSLSVTPGLQSTICHMTIVRRLKSSSNHMWSAENRWLIESSPTRLSRSTLIHSLFYRTSFL